MKLNKLALLAPLLVISTLSIADDPMITPVFNWPVGLTAQVTVEDVSQTSSDDNGAFEEKTSARYTLSTHARPNGLKITIRNAKFQSSNNKMASSGNSPIDQIIKSISSQYPDFLVSKNGVFLQNLNNEQIKLNITESLKAFATNVKEGREQDFKQLQQTALSDTRLTYISSTFWHLTVGQWLNGTFSADTVTEVQYEQPMDLLGGLKVPMIARFSLAGKVPCRRGTIEKECLRLVMQAKVDKKLLKKQLDLLSSNTGQAFPFDIHDVESKHVVITEQDTLIPHSTETSNYLNISISGGQSLVRHQTGLTRFKY